MLLAFICRHLEVVNFYYLIQITEKIHEMDVELMRWVEFGLNSSHSTSYAGNSHMVMIGCSLTKQLSAMHEKDLGVMFCVCLLNYTELFDWSN